MTRILELKTAQHVIGPRVGRGFQKQYKPTAPWDYDMSPRNSRFPKHAADAQNPVLHKYPELWMCCHKHDNITLAIDGLRPSARVASGL